MPFPVIITTNVQKLAFMAAAFMLLPAILTGIIYILTLILNLSWSLALGFSKLNVWYLFTGQPNLSNSGFFINFNTPVGKIYITMIALILFALLCAIIYEVIKKVFAWSFFSHDEYFHGRNQEYGARANNLSGMKSWFRWAAFTLLAIIFIPLLVLACFVVFNLAIDYIILPIFNISLSDMTTTYGASVLTSNQALAWINLNYTNIQNILENKITITENNVLYQFTLQEYIEKLLWHAEEQKVLTPEESIQFKTALNDVLANITTKIKTLLENANTKLSDLKNQTNNLWNSFKDVNEELFRLSNLITGKVLNDITLGASKLNVINGIVFDKGLYQKLGGDYNKILELAKTLTLKDKTTFSPLTNEIWMGVLFGSVDNNFQLTWKDEGLGIIMNNNGFFTTKYNGLDAAGIATLVGAYNGVYAIGTITQNTLNTFKDIVPEDTNPETLALRSSLVLTMLANNVQFNAGSNSLCGFILKTTNNLAFGVSLRLPLLTGGFTISSNPSDFNVIYLSQNIFSKTLYDQMKLVIVDSISDVDAQQTVMEFPVVPLIKKLAGNYQDPELYTLFGLPTHFIIIAILIMCFKFTLTYSFYFIWRCFNMVFDFILMILTGFCFAWKVNDGNFGPSRFYKHIQNIFSHLTMMLIVATALFTFAVFMQIVNSDDFSKNFSSSIFGGPIESLGHTITFSPNNHGIILSLTDLIHGTFTKPLGYVSYVILMLGSIVALMKLVEKVEVYWADRLGIERDERPSEVGKDMIARVQEGFKGAMIIGMGAYVMSQALVHTASAAVNKLSKVKADSKIGKLNNEEASLQTQLAAAQKAGRQNTAKQIENRLSSIQANKDILLKKSDDLGSKIKFNKKMMKRGLGTAGLFGVASAAFGGGQIVNKLGQWADKGVDRSLDKNGDHKESKFANRGESYRRAGLNNRQYKVGCKLSGSRNMDELKSCMDNPNNVSNPLFKQWNDSIKAKDWKNKADEMLKKSKDGEPINFSSTNLTDGTKEPLVKFFETVCNKNLEEGQPPTNYGSITENNNAIQARMNAINNLKTNLSNTLENIFGKENIKFSSNSTPEEISKALKELQDQESFNEALDNSGYRNMFEKTQEILNMSINADSDIIDSFNVHRLLQHPSIKNSLDPDIKNQLEHAQSANFRYNPPEHEKDIKNALNAVSNLKSGYSKIINKGSGLGQFLKPSISFSFKSGVESIEDIRGANPIDFD